MLLVIGSSMDWVAVGAAVVLAVTFTVAGLAKLRSKSATATDFASLGLPWPATLATLVPIAELTTAAILVVIPGWGGVLAATLLIGFTANLVLVLRSGRVATCACFGGSSREPVSARHVVRNVILLGLALAAATYDGSLWEALGS